MPILDSRRADPMFSGGTIDVDRERAVPLHREEPFQLMAAKAPPITIPYRTRPITHTVDHQLRAGRARVMTRISNLNPDNAGDQALTGVWGLNDPEAEEAPSMPTGFKVGGGVALLALAGFGIWLFTRGR